MPNPKRSFVWEEADFLLKRIAPLQWVIQVQFSIHFATEKLSLLEGEGIVRWSRPASTENPTGGMGVEITFLSDESRKEFIPYLSNLREKAYIPMRIT